MKVLNLDEVRAEPFEVILFGTSYTVPQPDFATYLELVGILDRTSTGAVSNSEALSLLRDLATKFLPTVPEEQLRKLDKNQLQALFEFIRQELQDGQANPTKKPASSKTSRR